MRLKNYLKTVARSGSVKFAKDMQHETPTGETDAITIDGQPFYYRIGTSDPHLAYLILMKKPGEYAMPELFSPKVILDIGANVGATARFFAREYPLAKIYCFEPVAENFAMLEKNIAAFPQIRAFNIGLGKKTETIKIFHSDNQANFGGFSRFQAGSDTGTTSTVQIEACEDFFAREHIDPIDFIKIDTEGAEYDILTAIPLARLANAQWIVGELHEQDDFKLLDYLSAHFEIGIKKTIGKRLSMFYAKKKVSG